jgi:hypothetical protein
MTHNGLSVSEIAPSAFVTKVAGSEATPSDSETKVVGSEATPSLGG